MNTGDASKLYDDVGEHCPFANVTKVQLNIIYAFLEYCFPGNCPYPSRKGLDAPKKIVGNIIFILPITAWLIQLESTTQFL